MHFTLLNSPFKALYSAVRFRVAGTVRNLEHSQRDLSPTTKTFSMRLENVQISIFL